VNWIFESNPESILLLRSSKEAHNQVKRKRGLGEGEPEVGQGIKVGCRAHQLSNRANSLGIGAQLRKSAQGQRKKKILEKNIIKGASS